jgi:hypothetical protein
MRSITSCLLVGSGGSNVMVPAFNTPSGTVTMTWEPSKICPSAVVDLHGRLGGSVLLNRDS